MSDRIIYTAIFGNYDVLKPISAKGWRCIVFTDGCITTPGWEVVQMKPYAKAFRHIKTCPHLFLPPHKQSVWMDGNISPKIEMQRIVGNKKGFWIMSHPHRNCLYAEAKRCIELGKDSEEIINAQVDRYRSENYPQNNGLIASGVIIRDADWNNAFNEAWWEEIKNGSVRDQLSANYVMWKMGLKYHTFPFLQNFSKVLHTKK